MTKTRMQVLVSIQKGLALCHRAHAHSDGPHRPVVGAVTGADLPNWSAKNARRMA